MDLERGPDLRGSIFLPFLLKCEASSFCVWMETLRCCGVSVICQLFLGSESVPQRVCDHKKPLAVFRNFCICCWEPASRAALLSVEFRLTWVPARERFWSPHLALTLTLHTHTTSIPPSPPTPHPRHTHTHRTRLVRWEASPDISPGFSGKSV